MSQLDVRCLRRRAWRSVRCAQPRATELHFDDDDGREEDDDHHHHDHDGDDGDHGAHAEARAEEVLAGRTFKAIHFSPGVLFDQLSLLLRFWTTTTTTIAPSTAADKVDAREVILSGNLP